MNTIRHTLRSQRFFCAVLVASLFVAAKTPAQPFGQWDFNSSNLTATVGTPLDYADGAGGPTSLGTAFGTTAGFGIPNINGTNAIVMRFPAATSSMGYYMPTPGANGGGGFVNEYTFILDLLYPSNGVVRPLLDTDGTVFVAGADFAVNAAGGIGVTPSGPFDGTLAANTWNRVGFTVTATEVRKYINGALLGSQSHSLDGRLALSQNNLAVILANSVGDAGLGYVNSIQIRDAALSPSQMAAMGGPSASGIPQTIPAIPSFVQTWTPPGAVARTSTDLGAVINPGEASLNTSTIVLKLNSVTQTGVQISSNGVTGLITVLKTGASLTAGTTYNLEVSYTDSQVGTKTFSKLFKAALLFEDFEQLALGTNIEEGLPTVYTNVWTKTPPPGWSLDDSLMPNVVANDLTNNGVAEWNGWSFASKTFWGVVTDNQNRQLFTLGQGTVAVADNDEWDDAAHPRFDTNGNALYFNSYLTTPTINISGVPANSIFMNFDSSWRPEGADDWGGTNNQTALITVSYNGGAPVEKLRWESIAGPNLHPDAENEKVSILLNNPVGATNMVVKIGALKAANDWWWAFDNLEINIGDIPSSIVQQIPTPGATNVAPQPTLGATIIPGTTSINPGSILLLLDGASVTVTVTTNTQGQLVVRGIASSVLPDVSTHTNRLVYTDSLNGKQTNTWSFTVDYDLITLGRPVWFENFDGVAEASFPTGWTATNQTTAIVTNFNLNDPSSASYQDFVVVSTNRLGAVFASRRFNVRPATLNGQAVLTLMGGNLVYGESDNRGGNQVQVLYSPPINLSGITGVYLAFNNIYEQNQDSMGAVEYSINGGATWLPALYMVAEADVIAGDPVAILGTARGDQAWGLAFGAFIGGTPDASFEPFISGRVDDDPTESKRIEKIFLPSADNQANVKLRFTHTGTGSWYFGIDDVGLYGNGATNVPVLIVNQPLPRNVFVSQSTTLTVGIDPKSTRPLSFQWLKNGTNVLGGATSQMYTLANAQLSDAGGYSVIVSNVSGAVTSAVAAVTVQNPLPSIVTQPASRLVYAGTPVSLSVVASTPIGTLSYQWYKDNGLLLNETNATLAIASAQAANQGAYYVKVSNSAGPTNSVTVQLSVFNGSLGDGLVAYLPFDGNYRDYSSRHHDGAPAGSPTFSIGRIGQSVRITTTTDGSINNYVTLGNPLDLQFGTNSFTVGLWVNFTNASDPTFISNKDWASSSNPGWGIFAQGGGNIRINATGTPGSSANRMSTTSTPVIRDGNWHFVLSSFWRDQFVATYVDGVLVNTTPLTITGTVDVGLAVNIGQDGTGNYRAPFDAFIDDVMLWNRVVTPQEMTLIYNAGTNGVSPLPVIGNVSRTGNSVTLDWTGGLPPFTIETKASVSSATWTPGGTTANRSITITVGGNTAIFRVRGAGQ